jgi:predicted small secreted protein
MAFFNCGVVMKKAILTILLVAATIVISGCGETISGVGKDVNRMGRGVSTFFFRQ